MPVEELVIEAKELDIETLVLTDINNTSGIMPFVEECKRQGIKPICGIEFRNGDTMLYTCIARDNIGLYQINNFYSLYRHRDEPFPDDLPEMDHVIVIVPLERAVPGLLKRPGTYAGVRPSDIPSLFRSGLRHFQDKLVMLHPVTFKNKQGYNLHRLLRAIDKNTLLSKLKPEEQAAPDEILIPPDELLRHYGAFPKIIFNTMQLTGQCSIDFDPAKNKNRKTFTDSSDDDRELLKKLAIEGAGSRYGQQNTQAIRRVFSELEIIDNMGFGSYYLISWDVIRYAQSRGFFHVGRGSGANSIVAYCLGITDVDPIELDLYFERFLNPHRSSPPDFDIDFSWRDRDEVTDYIFKRYGSLYTTLLATYVTFQGRSVIRELGKVFGLPKREIDEIVNHRDQSTGRDHITNMIFKYGKMMQDMPSHLSIHAGGILITERPIHHFTATDIPPKGFPITHFDMIVAEDNGFYKFDILSQRGLGHIKDTMQLIYRNKGVHVDIHKVAEFKNDSEINKRLAEGDSIGCFYIESPAMRQLLTKLECNNYPVLVAASSIIRPGVAKSGMMREYIFRHHNPGNFEYIHPKMEKLLEETYGVMVYQENVIKVAHHFAGITLAQADVLRRGMSGKRRSRKEIIKIQEEFFNNCRDRGIDEKITGEVWRQIESFSGYSFSKAHSASYAVESYQSLYLKTYFPHEFMVGVINNFGGFYSTEFYVREAQRLGADVQAPCVNNSEKYTSIHGSTIYLGFVHLKELTKKVLETILDERDRRGPFLDLEDFTGRVPTSVEQINILVRINSLRFTGKIKKVLLWESQMLVNPKPVDPATTKLFRERAPVFTLPDLYQDTKDDALDELELLGFTLSTPFELLEEEFPGAVGAGEMKNHIGKNIMMLGKLHTIKNVRTVKGGLMQFAGFWDSSQQLFDTVHFPPSVKKYPFLGKGLYLMKGQVTEEFGVCNLEVADMKKIPFINSSGPGTTRQKKGPVTIRPKQETAGRS